MERCIDESTRSVRRCGLSCLRSDRPVTFRSAIAEELPNFANFRDHVEVEVRYYHFVFIAAGLGDNLAAWIAEIALAVKLSNVPRLFDAYSVNGAHEITIGYGVRGLLQFPEIF